MESEESTKSTITAIRMGDSDSLRLGESVIAIGNALGIGQSVTTGVVSALNREITTDEDTTLRPSRPMQPSIPATAAAHF